MVIKKNVYYSQTGQDKFVDNILKQKKDGFCRCSNTNEI